MHRIFQTFIDLLASADDSIEFLNAMAVTAEALDLSCFAYLRLPREPQGKPRLITTYPEKWTSHYLKSRYERIDPIIAQAIQCPDPFLWGSSFPTPFGSPEQQRLFDEASQFGIRTGFTVPIHDGHGPVAALTFAASQREAPFEICTKPHARVLQLMAMYFHAHVRRKLADDHKIGKTVLSPREFECLEWAARGKSAWEIGCILGISRYTVASYLDNAKEKLGVRTIVQAVTRLSAAKREEHN
jgi:DNA-binding CsgD family transcriptional regulator